MGKPLAVITGASSGIGRATAVAFAAAGHPVLCLARHMQPVEQIDPERARFAQVDVTDFAALTAAVAAAESEFGPVDCLVNSAGSADARAFGDVEPADYEREVATDLVGVLHGMKVVTGGMTTRGHGTIVNISSVSDRKTSPVAVAYTASKYGVRAASECMREAEAASGVRVINIAPGYVRTNIQAGMGITLQQYEDMLGSPDFLSSEELASVILWCYQLPQHICVRDLAIAPTRSAF